MKIYKKLATQVSNSLKRERVAITVRGRVSTIVSTYLRLEVSRIVIANFANLFANFHAQKLLTLNFNMTTHTQERTG